CQVAGFAADRGDYPRLAHRVVRQVTGGGKRQVRPVGAEGEVAHLALVAGKLAPGPGGEVEQVDLLEHVLMVDQVLLGHGQRQGVAVRAHLHPPDGDALGE
ncbi:hypothetical protein RZS08_03040, partial [Arthrospira platensis SPKY1]|nr:hypothetical protein [Arthrospira platensis SPKY1]